MLEGWKKEIEICEIMKLFQPDGIRLLEEQIQLQATSCKCMILDGDLAKLLGICF